MLTKINIGLFLILQPSVVAIAKPSTKSNTSIKI